jgi:nucleoside phosphorylase
MTGLVFTTAEEADDFLQSVHSMRAERLSEGDVLSLGPAVVSILGVGKIKATLNTERLLRAHDLDRVLHVGTCMALSDAVDVGTLVGASFVLEGDRVHLDAPTYPRMPLECPFETDTTGTVVTQDHDIGDTEDRSYWQRIGDVSDTSGYAVAYVAAQHGVPCHVVKVVTSQAGVDSDSFLEDRSAAHARIASFLQQDVFADDIQA